MFRTEGIRFAFARESVDGTRPTTINTNMGLIKGGVILPDVEYAWDPFYGVGRGGRSRLDIHEGLQSFRASVPQIHVLFNESRAILEQVFGVLSQDVAESSAASANITYAATTVTHVGEDFTAPNRKDGNYAIFAGNSVGYVGTNVGGGVTELTVYPTPTRSGTAGWNGPIPISGASGDGYEIRQTESVGTAAGDKFIVPLSQMLTMAWGVTFRGSRGQANLGINYLGGKVNRATLGARSGEKLTLALDDVLFREIVHDATGNGVAKSGTVTAPTPTHPTEQPLVFSQGDVTWVDTSGPTVNTLLRITSFSLSIDHQLTEQTYLDLVTVNGANVISQIPYELTEGLRVFTCEIEGFLDTRIYYQYLMRQADNSAAAPARTGLDVRLVFFPDAAGAEKLIIQSPAAANPVLAAGIDTASPVTTALSSTANVGAVIEAAPHPIPAETESLIPIRMRLNLPNVVLAFDDS